MPVPVEFDGEHLPQFMLLLSSACPASCSYCFGPHSGPVMSPATLELTLDFIKTASQRKKSRITFHGGEPLVAGHALFRQAVEGLRMRLGCECKLSVQSNLWLLDDAFCELFAENGVTIGTSLDGPEGITDLQRGKGYFERTMAGINRARAHGLSVGCIATFTPAIVARWRDVLDFFHSERIDFTVHAAVPPIAKPDSPFALKPAAYAELLRVFLDAYIELRQDLKLGTLDDLCRGVAANAGQVCTHRDCLGMFLAIDPLGDVFACQRLCSRQEYRLGSVADRRTVNELLSSQAAQQWRERELSLRETCGQCEHFAYCKGGCPYNAIAGSNGPRDPYCEAYRAIFDTIKARMLAELSCEENLQAITNEPWDGRGHPLVRRGPLLDLMRKDCHPTEVARHARRIVAAVEVAREPDRNVVADRLVRRGICRTFESAQASLESLEARLHPTTRSWNNLYVHVTFACQLHCNHCYAVASPDGPTMAPAAAIRLFEQAHAARFRQLVVTGGEPLVHPDRRALLSGLQAARARLALDEKPESKSTRLVLRTNFALDLSNDELDAIAGAFDQIVVSIDGSREVHDARRGTGSYDATIGNLERYQALKLESRGELSLSAVLPTAELDGDQERAVRALAQRVKIQQTRFRPLLPLGRAATWKTPPTLNALPPSWNPLRQIEEGVWPTSSCGLGQNLYVDPGGEAFPCYAFHGPNARLGNVMEEGLAAVLESQSFRDIACHSVDTNVKCSQCDVRYLCGGACKAWGGELSDAALDAPPPDCSSLRERAERLLRAADAHLGRAGNYGSSV